MTLRPLTSLRQIGTVFTNTNTPWSMNFTLGHVIKAQHNFPWGSVPYSLCDCVPLPTKKRDLQLHTDSPAAPQATSSSSGPQIPYGMLDFLGTLPDPLSCRWHNSKGHWEIRDKVSEGRCGPARIPVADKDSVQEGQWFPPSIQLHSWTGSPCGFNRQI